MLQTDAAAHQKGARGEGQGLRLVDHQAGGCGHRAAERKHRRRQNQGASPTGGSCEVEQNDSDNKKRKWTTTRMTILRTLRPKKKQIATTQGYPV